MLFFCFSQSQLCCVCALNCLNTWAAAAHNQRRRQWTVHLFAWLVVGCWLLVSWLVVYYQCTVLSFFLGYTLCLPCTLNCQSCCCCCCCSCCCWCRTVIKREQENNCCCCFCCLSEPVPWLCLCVWMFVRCVVMCAKREKRKKRKKKTKWERVQQRIFACELLLCLLQPSPEFIRWYFLYLSREAAPSPPSPTFAATLVLPNGWLVLFYSLTHSLFIFFAVQKVVHQATSLEALLLLLLLLLLLFDVPKNIRQ